MRTCGVLATVGALQVKVYAKPTVSIITTGDELVAVNEQPEPYQIRNSNSYSLAAQVQRAGGAIAFRTVARDTEDALASALDRALNRTWSYFRVAYRPASTTSWKPCWPSTAPSSISLELRFSQANQRCSAEHAGNSSLVSRATLHPRW